MKPINKESPEKILWRFEFTKNCIVACAFIGCVYVFGCLIGTMKTIDVDYRPTSIVLIGLMVTLIVGMSTMAWIVAKSETEELLIKFPKVEVESARETVRIGKRFKMLAASRCPDCFVKLVWSFRCLDGTPDMRYHNNPLRCPKCYKTADELEQ